MGAELRLSAAGECRCAGVDLKDLAELARPFLKLRAAFFAARFVLPLLIRAILDVLRRHLRGGLVDLLVHGLQLRVVADKHPRELLRLGVRGGGLELLRRAGDLLPQIFAAGDHVVGDGLEVLRPLLDGAILPIQLFRTRHLRAAGRGEGRAEALVKTVRIVAERLHAARELLKLADGLPDPARLQTAHQLVRSENLRELLGIAERFHISLHLLELLGKRLDLLDLIFNRLDPFRDVLQVHLFREHVGNGVGHDILRRKEWRGGDEGGESEDEFHSGKWVTLGCGASRLRERR